MTPVTGEEYLEAHLALTDSDDGLTYVVIPRPLVVDLDDESIMLRFATRKGPVSVPYPRDALLDLV